MIVYTSKKEKVELEDKPLASGGEGEVHRVVSCPRQFTNVCAKLYFKPQQTVEKEKKIRYMVENPPSPIVGKGSMLAWPVETIYSDKKRFIGFLMPTAFPGSKKLVILTTPKIKSSLKEQWAKFDKEKDKKVALISRLKLVNNIAIPIHFLHETDKYVLKDFKPDNVLVTPNGKVIVVDMDSIQICDKGKMLFEGSAATLEYIPPEFYKGVGQDKKVPLEKSWDNFAISVVFYQLIFGLHPYVSTPKNETEESHTISHSIKENLFPFGSNSMKIKTYPKLHDNFKVIPQEVRALFIRAFGDNPNNRPLAMEWGKTIHSILRSIEGGPTPPPRIPSPPTPSAPKKRCAKCGEENSQHATYCRKCGSILDGAGKGKHDTLIAVIVVLVFLALLLIFLASML